MKKEFLLLAFATVVFLTANSQTNVSGGIYSNTTWTLANSPYIVTDTVVLFPGYTLTIEPGVVVKFDDDVVLEIRQSTLIALGTSANKIIFTSNSNSPHAGCWKGIDLDYVPNTQLEYCEFDYADVALRDANLFTIQNISFSFNNTCVYGYSSVTLVRNTQFNNNGACIPEVGYPCFVDSCVFNGNNSCFEADGEIHVTDCQFTGNTFGIAIANLYGDHAALINCTFCNNVNACRNGNHRMITPPFPFVDSLINCSFISNHLGYEGTFRTMIGNIFTNNDTAWAGSSDDSAYMHDNYIFDNGIGILGGFIASGPDVYNNNICHNRTYNIRYVSNGNSTCSGLCFCDSDSTSIAAGIYDGYDDISLGLLTFTPFVNCDSSALNGIVPASCSSISNGISDIINPFSGITIFPNPSISDVIIQTENYHKDAVLNLYNSYGQLVRQIKNLAGNKYNLNREGLSGGLYFIRLTENDKIFATQKILFVN